MADKGRSATCERNGHLASGKMGLLLVSLLACGGCMHEAQVFSGLKPDHPPAWNHGCAPVTVRQPTLRWQAFVAPREATANEPSEHSLTYELRIWEANQDVRGPLVYARAGLVAPSHTVQEPLNISTTYFWSLRARFLLKGRPRVTDWGQQLYLNIEAADPQSTRWKVIGHHYYRYYCFYISPDES